MIDPDSRPAPPLPHPPPRPLPTWLLGLVLSVLLLAGWAIFVHVAPEPEPRPPEIAVAPPAAAPAQELRVLVWRNILDQQILADFEKETAVKVVREDYDTNEQLTALMDSNRVTYDVVFVSGIDLEHLLDRDLLQVLPAVANSGNINRDIASHTTAYDPENRHSVVLVWGSVGLGYDAAKVKERLGDDALLDSWAVLFDTDQATKLADCGIQVVSSPRGVFPIALKFLGLPAESAKPEDTEAATRIWESIRPFISKFGSEDVAGNLADGKTCLSLATSSDVYRARLRNGVASSNLRYVVPKEGSIAWYGLLGIPKAAASTDNAVRFIDFLLRPQVAARITNGAGLPNAVRDSESSVLPDVRSDLGLFPDAAVQSRLINEAEPSAAAAALRNRFWQLINTPSTAPLPAPAPSAAPETPIPPAVNPPPTP